MYIIPLTSIEHNPSLGFTFPLLLPNPYLLSLALSLSTSLKICENECKDLVSLKTRVCMGST